MFRQNQVLRTLSAAQSQDRLASVLADERLKNRNAIARRVCEVFNFVDARGRIQLTTCVVALKKLADRGQIVLPPPQHSYAADRSPRRLQEGVPMPCALPRSVREVEDLSVMVVTDDDQRAVWNTLLHQEHPRGTTKFLGAQVRYLITSAHGYLGALGFSAATLRLADRERWMTWSDAQRKAHLNHVTCLSRFLIRGRCANLASHVLGRVLRRLSSDYEKRYGYHLWVVETYVDPSWKGTCFKAANFRHIGFTAGGRRKPGDAPKTPKALYVYELDRAWRRKLGVPAVKPSPVRLPQEGLDTDQWTEVEFGGAPLGNRLRSARLVRSASMLAAVLGKGITRSSEYDRAAVKGHYRFLQSDPDSKVTPKNILAPHRARTIERMRSQKTVLCIQDGSRLRFPNRPACTGLQVISGDQNEAQMRGIHIHATLATTTDGLPLGVLHCSYREPSHGPLKPTAQHCLDGFLDICAAADQISRKIRVICVMDREADSFALFDAQRRHKHVDVLVRARPDRRLTDGRKLDEALAAGPSAGSVRIQIKSATARPKASGKPARPGRSYRTADAAVRFCQVTLPSTIKGADPVTMYGVYLEELAPPKGETAKTWCLLSSVDVDTLDGAMRIIDHYVKRRRIGDFFRVLKHGCKVEHLAMRTALRMERAIAIYLVIAWHAMVRALLGRPVPMLDVDAFFTKPKLHVLTGSARRV